MDVKTFPVNLQITSGLSILLHGVISLSDATSCDKTLYHALERDRLLYHKCDGVS